MNTKGFETINQGYDQIFKMNQLTIGLVVPIESYDLRATPTLNEHIEMVQLAQMLGFKAVWLRDIPFNVPSFGDVGQMHDPFVYLGFLAAHTQTITLGVGSIILPLRHPAHIAKAAASVDDLSQGRLVLGVASGDRPEEYPALNISYENRGDKFREGFEYIQKAWHSEPTFENPYGTVQGGLDMLPKPMNKKVPMLITGASQQNPIWVSSNGDGWITYPRNPELQGKLIGQWRHNAREQGIVYEKPVSQSLYVDLIEDNKARPEPIHLGYRTGCEYLLKHLKQLELVGVNHVAINLRFNQANIKNTLEKLAQEILPAFNY